MSEPTAGQKTVKQLNDLLRARASLVWIVTSEEKRAEAGIAQAAGMSDYMFRSWDHAAGIRDLSGKEVLPGDKAVVDPRRALEEVSKRQERAVWVMRDLPKFLENPGVLRAVRNLQRELPSVTVRAASRSLVILSTSDNVPAELRDGIAVIKWPLPDREEIGRILEEMLQANPKARETLDEHGGRDAAIEAAVGLTVESASICYAKCFVEHKAILPAKVAEEKRRVVNAAKGVEWSDPDPRGLDGIGGLDLLKAWLLARKVGFSAEARDFGLPLPKGVLLVGVPGTGKSLTAKATAAAMECPLLRLDMGAAQSKWVGESQANIRNALVIAETVGRCVLWIDEIEKALGDSVSDSGVSADALGTLLSWMQERKGQVFVIATANDVSKLPPELLRKGRWDELFFVDLPTAKERREILHVALKRFGRDPRKVITLENELLRVTDRFSGAEIDALVSPALYAAFADGKRELRCADLIAAAKETTPLANTAKGKIDQLREWADGRARRVSSLETVAEPGVSGTRVIDDVDPDMN